MPSATYVRPLEDAAAFGAGQIGGKARNLQKLGEIPGVAVPPGSVLSAAALEHFIRASFPPRRMAELAEAYFTPGKQALFFAALAAARFPADLQREILRAVPRRGVVIVRSSGTREDSAAQSLAGHYASIVTRTDPASVLLTIKNCWLVGLRVFLSLLYQGAAQEPARALDEAIRSLALVIQTVVDARKSGVYFTQSPTHPAGKAMAVANFGTCHAVVDGALATDVMVVDGGRIDSANVSYKFEMTVLTRTPEKLIPGQTIRTPLGPTAYHVPYSRFIGSARVPPELGWERTLDDREVRQLSGTAARAREWLGHEVDMEWSFLGKRLVLLQARPITTQASKVELDPDSEYSVASPGVATGVVRVVRDVEEIGKVRQGDVMVVANTDPDYMPAFYRAAAVVSEDGSPLSHTAIVARELKIPCITGVTGATTGAFLDGEIICVDANRGRIARDPKTQVNEAAATRGRDGVIYRLDHLGRLGRERRPRIAASALLAGFLDETRGEAVTPAAVAAYLKAVKRRYGLRGATIQWDVLEPREVLEQEPGVSELKAAAPGGRF